MYMKQLNVQSAIYKMDNAGRDGEFFGIVSAVVSIQAIIVWYMEFRKKTEFLKKQEVLFRNTFIQTLKML